jgi:hypothetical protein
MLIIIIAILIASAVSDSFGEACMLYVAIIATGYIVSRGIAKADTDHWPEARRRTQ